MALNRELLTPRRGAKPVGSNAVAVMITLSVMVLVWVAYQPDNSSYLMVGEPKCPASKLEEPGSGLVGKEGLGPATSGRLFLGKPVRTLPEHIRRRFAGNLKKSQRAGENQKWINRHNFCDKWSVVTTIFEPSDAVKVQGKLGGGWCLVVVGDRKGPFEYPLPEFNKDGKFVFLDADKQKQMFDSLELGSIVPWGHFGRKTFGYLYAIAHGAKLVWDFDDDNMLRTKDPVAIQEPNSAPNTTVFTIHDSKCKSFNPYPAMGTKFLPSWPRGLPLEDIKDEACQVRSDDLIEESINTGKIAIYQSLANHDPDVDAIYRLTQPLPFEFDDPRKRYVMVPTTAMSPFNAQATLFTYDALFLLLLPVSVHGRVSDIWRSYYAQRLLLDCNRRIVFSPPQVDQYRNAHNYLADIDSELDLYKKSGKMIEFLAREWAPEKPTDSIPSRWEQLTFELYKRDFIDVEDIELAQAWIQQLVDINYIFPKVTQ